MRPAHAVVAEEIGFRPTRIELTQHGAGTCYFDDSTAVSEAGRQAVGNAMRNACKSAGMAAYSLHDLRHRHISVKIREGVPITNIAAHVGHSRKSLTLDTYAHVLIDD